MVIQMVRPQINNLDEAIGIHLTREEWAVVLMGLSFLPTSNARIHGVAQTLSGLIQNAAAPVSVINEVIAKHAGG